MAHMDAFYRSLPKAPHTDVNQIRGNVSDFEKQLTVNIINFFMTGRGPSKVPRPFAHEFGLRTQVVQLNVWNDVAGVEGEIVLEVKITEGACYIESPHQSAYAVSSLDMCNILGSMHGSYAVYLLDMHVCFIPAHRARR
jgi:hypothetical protein